MTSDDYMPSQVFVEAELVDADPATIRAVAEAEADLAAGRSVFCADDEALEVLLNSFTAQPQRQAG